MAGKKITVLIAENNDGSRPSALKEALAAMPEVESVHLVSNGASVLGAVKGIRPDVLLIDLVLPGIDGLEVLRKMAATRLPKSPVIIVCTAIMREAIIDEAQRCRRKMGCTQNSGDLRHHQRR